MPPAQDAVMAAVAVGIDSLTASHLIRMKKLPIGIDLSDSWVLGWKSHDDQLQFDLEISIWPESPHYESPKKGEHTCYKHGTLRFEGITSMEGLKDMASTPKTTDPDGTTDYGTIETFEIADDSIRLTGDFGDIYVHCTAWTLELENGEHLHSS